MGVFLLLTIGISLDIMRVEPKLSRNIYSYQALTDYLNETHNILDNLLNEPRSASFGGPKLYISDRECMKKQILENIKQIAIAEIQYARIFKIEEKND
jgi:hypothetical protein